jgi:hypothetical protein
MYEKIFYLCPDYGTNGPKYHYNTKHFTKLYVTVAATRIKPDDPYRKVTEEGVSSLSLDHSHFRGAETGGKYKQGALCRKSFACR